MITSKKELDNSILSRHNKIYAKFEPIVTRTLEVYSNEILFRLDNKNTHIKVLDELRKNDETFSLFIRIAKKAFDEAYRTWVWVNINLEISDILNNNFIDYLSLLLSIYSIDSSKINFELLECSDIEESEKEKIITKIKIISDMWFLFSVDDLYSWYSNKQRINLLLSEWISINTVKVDWKFLREMFDSYKKWFSIPYVNKNYSLNDFADFKQYISELHEKWIKVVAEWIENEELFNFAKELWFDYYQGYYIQNLNKEIQEI